MSPAGRGFAVLLASLWLTLSLAGASLAQTFPALSGRVVDTANVLPPATEAELTGRLAALEQATSRQLVVATVPSLQGYEIEEYGYRLGRAWGLGRADQDDGAILLVAPAERKVRIEVGYGLEPILTDALSNTILTTRVLPRFKAGDMPGGVVAGTDALIEHLGLPPEQAAARAAAAARRPERNRGGGGIGPVIVALILFFMLSALLGGRNGGRRRRRHSGSDWVVPAIIWAASSRSGRGGGWGGGGFGGGGFSGGGGSFGGGGASGSW